MSTALGGVASFNDERDARARYLLFAHVIERIGEAVARVDAPAMLVKGAALALTVYPKPWLRPMGDIDVLVRERDREHVLDALSRRGFQVGPPPADRRVSAHLLGETPVLFGTEGTSILVEVHHRLDKIIRHPIDYEGVFARSAAIGGLRVPCTTDHALLVILHAALSEFRHEPAWQDLELLFGAGVEVDALITRASAWGLRAASFLALFALRARGSEAVPGELVDALAPTGLARRSLELFYRVEREPAPRTPLSLGVRWLVRQAPLCDGFGGWLSSTARYAAARARDRLHG